MCGIAGFIDYSISTRERADQSLTEMLERIIHRGPDGEGRWVHPAGRAAAGMRRLSIIDLKSGDQPLWNEDKTLGVVFNGEIYNYKELRTELKTRGHVFQTASDTEVLVHGYELCGVEFLNKVRGMFSVCWIDLRKEEFILARDRFGQKPLYWFHKNGLFAFASEIKALRSLGRFPAAVRPEALLDYLTWFSLPSPETHYEDVFKLEPGRAMRVSWGKQAEQHTPRLPETTSWRIEKHIPEFQGTLEDAGEELDARMKEAISLHLRSDVPLGLLLSGGVDSLAIGHFARMTLDNPPLTYTAVFDAPGTERDAAARTSEWIGSRHTEIVLTKEDVLARIDSVSQQLDEPMADPAALALGMVCERAAQDVKVLLSGEGSDELFGGYAGRYAGEQATLEKSRRLRSLFWFLGEKSPTEWPKTRLQRMRWRIGAGFSGELPSLPVEGFPGTPREGFTEAQSVRFLRRCAEIGARIVPRTGSTMSRCQRFDQNWQLPEFLLRKADKMSMAYSVELRAPFLDPRLANFADSLPDEFRMKKPDGPGKLVLRHLLESKYGVDTMGREKKGFVMPFQHWMKEDLRAPIEERIFDPGAAWRQTLDAELIRSAWDRFLSGQGMGFHVFYALWLYETWRRALS